MTQLELELSRAEASRIACDTAMRSGEQGGYPLGYFHGWVDAVIEIEIIKEKLAMEFKAALEAVVIEDVEGLMEARSEYGDSWKMRGGPGAYFTLVRPLDRLDKLAAKPASNGVPFDVFQHILDCADGDTGVLNAVRDLRRYLTLVEANLLQEGHVLPTQRHNLAAAKKRLTKAVLASRVDVVDMVDAREIMRQEKRG